MNEIELRNIFDDLPQHLPSELVQILIRDDDVRIERIISHGHASPADFWYDQPRHEWVYRELQENAEWMVQAQTVPQV